MASFTSIFCTVLVHVVIAKGITSMLCGDTMIVRTVVKAILS